MLKSLWAFAALLSPKATSGLEEFADYLNRDQVGTNSWAPIVIGDKLSQFRSQKLSQSKYTPIRLGAMRSLRGMRNR